MELSLFLAQLFGLTMIVCVLAFMFRSDLLERVMNELRSSPSFMLLAGFVGVMGGLAVILSHNIWEMNWRGLVTLFGWSALLKGVAYIAFPDCITGTAGKLMSGRGKNFVLIIALLAGCYLAYNGFGVGM